MPPPPLQPGEEPLLSTRPHPITIVTRSAFSVILLAVYAVFLMGPVAVRSGTSLAWILLYAAIAVAGLRVVVEIVRWLHRRYTLTNERLTSSDGLLRRWHVEMPLGSIQYVVLHKSITERLLGLGTVGASSAGGGLEILWLNIAKPQHAHDTIITARDAARAAALHRERAGTVPSNPDRAPSPRSCSEERGEGGVGGEEQPERSGTARPSPHPSPRCAEPQRGEGAGQRPLIIGLAGGIGSGKSAVARALQSLGAAISDSDAEAKAALQSPAVKESLRQWWGDRVLAADGSVDRRAVADIVFRDPAQRQRLEALIHPMLHATRERFKQDAAARGIRVVVIDAPLLFEAGVDGECDEAWFVESSREQRLGRVSTTRGWDDAELARREAAQMSLDEKRRRSARVILNDGDEATLRARVGEALERAMLGTRPERERAGPADQA